MINNKVYIDFDTFKVVYGWSFDDLLSLNRVYIEFTFRLDEISLFLYKTKIA